VTLHLLWAGLKYIRKTEYSPGALLINIAQVVVKVACVVADVTQPSESASPRVNP